MAKQSFDIDDDLFIELEDAIKGVLDVVKSWKEKDKALGTLAQQQAAAEGAVEGEDMDAKVYTKRKALKQTIQEQMKSAPVPPMPGDAAAPPLPPMPPMGAGQPPALPPMG